MTKLTISEIKEMELSYTTLVCVCQILGDVTKVYANKCERKNELHTVYLDTKKSEEEISVILGYLKNSKHSLVIKRIDERFDINCVQYDLDIMFNDGRVHVATLESDLKDLFILTEDNNMRLYVLNELVRMRTSDLSNAAKCVELSSRSNVPVSMEVITSLCNFAFNYMHYGKRAAFKCYTKLLGCREQLNAITEYFELDNVLI